MKQISAQVRNMRRPLGITFAILGLSLIIFHYQACSQNYELVQAPMETGHQLAQDNSGGDLGNQLGSEVNFDEIDPDMNPYVGITPPESSGAGNSPSTNPNASPDQPSANPIQEQSSVAEPEPEPVQAPMPMPVPQPEPVQAPMPVPIPVPAPIQCNKELLQNGDFEVLDNRIGLSNKLKLSMLMSTGKRWDVFASLPASFENLSGASWIATDGTSGIEVQASLVTPASGNHYVELDSHANSARGNVTNSGMYQIVPSAAAGEYVLAFSYRGRTEYPDDNRINVLINGQKVHSIAEAALGPKWTRVEIPVSLNAGDNRIEFQAEGWQNTYGGFLDAISLMAKCE